ncbi:MAG: hypothetical protein ACK41C_18730 [Phenylobacterium sp.]
MSRFLLQYPETPDKPPHKGWGPWRVFVWTLLVASLALWGWALLS